MSDQEEAMFSTSDAAEGQPGRVFGFLRNLPGLACRAALANSWISLTLAVSASMLVALAVLVVLPGYTSPMSRLYSSKFGYGAVLRKLGKPFPVTATSPTRRMLSRSCLGEGLVRSEPFLVSIIPMGTIKKLYVKDGDFITKGQLLAEVESTKAEIKVDAARAALATAKAELERVKIGSAYILTYERPKLDAIKTDAAKRSLAVQKQLQDINLNLIKKGFGTREETLKQELFVIQADLTLRQTLFDLGMSQQGVVQSVVVAESAVLEAELALKHRLHELKEHKIHAIADGRLERCLVHEGEYNQDPGKPGFMIASGAWFEANFDQGAIRRVHVGDSAEVRLEALPERGVGGTVSWINSFVNYDLGGPESTRPIRPMGTGAPEWPATFVVKVTLDPVQEVPILPGMTGFAVIRAQTEVLCLPREAVFAITAGRGLVYLVDGDQFRPREVTLGIVDGDYIEIREGLRANETVILEGHQVLEPGDRIRVVPES